MFEGALIVCFGGHCECVLEEYCECVLEEYCEGRVC